MHLAKRFVGKLAVLAAILSGVATVTAQETKPARTPAPPAPPITAHIYTKENVPATPKLEDLPLKESASQYGITWTFEKPARVGQFVTGDFYVVGDVTIKMIDPKPLWGDEVKETINKQQVEEADYKGKEARNGSSLNPVPRKKGVKGYNRAGFDSRIPGGRYDPEQFTQLPIQMKPGDALVSTISRENREIKSFGGQHVDPLRVAAVLTCLAEPQPADAFRPSYCDTKNSKIFLARNLRRELLLNLPKMEGAPENLARYVKQFQKPWIDLADFGFAAPVQNLPHYGQQMAERVGEASLLLLMDYPAEEKEAVTIGFVQAGIDLHGVARGGFVWMAHGGLYAGRKWPIILSGVLLDDPDMQAPQKKLPDLRFHEDDQTAMGPVTYKDPKTGEKKQYATSWTGSKAIFLGHSPYLFERSGHYESGWGLLDVFHPSEWPVRKTKPGAWQASEGYRRANTSAAWIAQALAARMMHLEKVWNHDAFFAYEDRWMTQDESPFYKDIVAANFPNLADEKNAWQRQGNTTGTLAKWVGPMWKKYRNNLPPAKDGSKTPPDTDTWK
jgi:hypothetical protein